MNIVQDFVTQVGSRLAAEGDIRALLRKDHEEALELTRQICDATKGEQRKTLFKKLKPALVAHSRAEEAVVYRPLMALKEDKDARGIGNEGFVEHGLLDVLLEKMSASRSPESEAWSANAKVLHELLQHHVDEEHSQMFSELAANFDEGQLEAMGRKFLAAKSALQG
jgi:hemerythrin-like domain-containing protein